jgi:UDPglucose 6-dehydrogenase
MQVCVCGLWHLGSVTASCLAEHFPTIGFDPDRSVIANLTHGKPPLFEPGLAELVNAGLQSGKLSFTGDLERAVGSAEVVWVTYDTPVDENDVADVEFVADRIAELFPHLKNGAVVLISSQIPVGFAARMETAWRQFAPDRKVDFAYSPENLRLGKALDVFRKADRIVAGTRSERARAILSKLFQPFTSNIEWMRVESAEMTKHSLNAFLANSVVFINEIAAICEAAGADAKEVERGLKTDVRIGPRAYLSPGGAFAGGTLARDVNFLMQLGIQHDIQTELIQSIAASNDHHKKWPRRAIQQALGNLQASTVAILGLTYKPGTDTLRRSTAVELSEWLTTQGATVNAFDPAVLELPAHLKDKINLCKSVSAALDGADCAVIATECPEFKQISSEQILQSMRRAIVLDANRFLAAKLENAPNVTYISVGKGIQTSQCN